MIGPHLLSFVDSVRTALSSRNLVVVTLCYSILQFASFLWRPFWSLYIMELGGSKGVVGVLATLQSLSTLFLLLPGGILADKFGRRRLILFSTACGIVPPLVFISASHWTGLVLGIVASSLSSLSVPAQTALIAESLPPEKRATGFGFYTMSWYLFIVASYPIGGWLMDSMGVTAATRLGLTFTLLVMVPILLIQWRYVGETLSEPRRSTERLSAGKVLSQLRKAPGQVWALLAVALFSSFAFQAFWSFVTIYSVEVVGMTKMEWSIASIASNLVAGLFMMPTGFLSDRAKRKPYVVLSQSLVAASSLGYVLSTGFLSLVVTRVLGGIGEGIGGNVFGPTGGPVWQALVTDVAPEEMRGSVLGLMGAVTGFASTPAPMVGGWMYEAMTPQAPFYLSFGLATVGVMVFVATVREPRRAFQDSA